MLSDEYPAALDRPVADAGELRAGDQCLAVAFPDERGLELQTLERGALLPACGANAQGACVGTGAGKRRWVAGPGSSSQLYGQLLTWAVVASAAASAAAAAIAS